MRPFLSGYCERAERVEDTSMHIKLEKRQGKAIESGLCFSFIELAGVCISIIYLFCSGLYHPP